MDNFLDDGRLRRVVMRLQDLCPICRCPVGRGHCLCLLWRDMCSKHRPQPVSAEVEFDIVFGNLEYPVCFFLPVQISLAAGHGCFSLSITVGEENQGDAQSVCRLEQTFMSGVSIRHHSSSPPVEIFARYVSHSVEYPVFRFSLVEKPAAGE